VFENDQVGPHHPVQITPGLDHGAQFLRVRETDVVQNVGERVRKFHAIDPASRLDRRLKQFHPDASHHSFRPRQILQRRHHAVSPLHKSLGNGRQECHVPQPSAQLPGHQDSSHKTHSFPIFTRLKKLRDSASNFIVMVFPIVTVNGIKAARMLTIVFFVVQSCFYVTG